MENTKKRQVKEMTDHKAKSCFCKDCKEKLINRFDELIYSFDQDMQETIYELMAINDLLQNALHGDINSEIAELCRKGYIKINISITGKTAEGKKIKSKKDVVICLV